MYWLYPVGYGILTGFLMSVLLGVIFFMLIQVGVKHGVKKGFTIAAGVITGDIIFVTLAIGFTGIISSFLRAHEGKVSVVGGLVLLIMGLAAFFQRRKLEEMNRPPSPGRNARDYFIKPFIINFLNPANAAWWLGLFSIPPALNFAMDQKIVFAAAAVATVFFTEVGVAAAASRLKKYIKPEVLKKVDTVVGVALLAVGLKLIWQGCFG